jgi:probable F420-dependent oxidoreductase
MPLLRPRRPHRGGARSAGSRHLLAPEVAVVVDQDADSARATAREYARLYLGLGNYTSNLLRHGFDEADVAEGGSDRLLDAVVPQGSAAQIAAVVQAHLDAGADHVAVQTLGDPGIPARSWGAIAQALRD